MKQLSEIARRKVIALVSAVDAEATNIQDLCVNLRNRGFKPPHGRYWTESKILEVMTAPEVEDSGTITCPMCRQKIDSDSRRCPECWTNLEQ